MTPHQTHLLDPTGALISVVRVTAGVLVGSAAGAALLSMLAYLQISGVLS